MKSRVFALALIQKCDDVIENQKNNYETQKKNEILFRKTQNVQKVVAT
jgi:hypothetical protein